MTVLITGAYGGIGKSVCAALAQQGKNIAITGRDSEKLSKLASELGRDYDIQVFYQACDLLDTNDIKELKKSLFANVKHISEFIHCAGVLSESSLMMTRADDIESDFKVNLFSAIELAQFVSKLMLRNKRGVITLFSSIVANQGSSGQSIYGASKLGIVGFVKSLAKELGPTGIRVNAISPGFIDTDLVAHYDENKKKQLAVKTSLKRLGNAQDVANLVAFIHSEKASYITGQVISIDGGLTL